MQSYLLRGILEITVSVSVFITNGFNCFICSVNKHYYLINPGRNIYIWCQKWDKKYGATLQVIMEQFKKLSAGQGALNSVTRSTTAEFKSEICA